MSLSEFVSQDVSSDLEIPVIVFPPRIAVLFRKGEPFYAEFCVNVVVSNTSALEADKPYDQPPPAVW